MILNEYLKAQNKTNEDIINGSFTPDELERFPNRTIVGQITDQKISNSAQ